MLFHNTFAATIMKQSLESIEFLGKMRKSSKWKTFRAKAKTIELYGDVIAGSDFIHMELKLKIFL